MRYRVTATFSLDGGEHEADGFDFDNGYAEDVEDNSYFQSTTLQSDGGNISFTVEADSEDEAEDAGRQVIDDGSEVTDSNDWTWVVDGLSFDIERIVVPMTLERADEVLTRLAEERDEDDEVAEAVEFVLAHIREQDARIRALSARIDELAQMLTDVRNELKALRDGGQAPTVVEGLQDYQG